MNTTTTCVFFYRSCDINFNNVLFYNEAKPRYRVMREDGKIIIIKYKVSKNIQEIQILVGSYIEMV